MLGLPRPNLNYFTSKMAEIRKYRAKVYLFVNGYWQKVKYKPDIGLVKSKSVYYASALLVVAGLLLYVTIDSLATEKSGLAEKYSNKAALKDDSVQSQNAGQPNHAVVAKDLSTNEGQAAMSVRPVVEKQEMPQRPVEGEIVTEFGWQYHRVYKDWRYNNGVDILCAAGSSINALAGGTVTKVYRDRNYGLTVTIRTTVGDVSYGSLSASAVSTGDSVRAGQKIGAVDKPQSNLLEPHLHLAVKRDDKYIDPRSLLP